MAERREPYKCPGCGGLQTLRIEGNNFVEDEKGNRFEFEDLATGYDGFHQPTKCFWDAPETKQKIQQYRSKFAKYFDYRDTGSPMSLFLKPKPNLDLKSLEKVKEEILKVPLVDVCVLNEALIPKSFEKEIGRGKTSYDKQSIIQQIQSRINELSKSDKPNNPSTNKCEKCKVNPQQIRLTEIEETTNQEKILMFCEGCAEEYTKCQSCQQKKQESLTTIKRDGKTIRICSECKNKPQNDEREKPINKPTNSNECCERCQVSCRDEKRGVITRRRITHYYTDFRKTVNYFGMNCHCAEEFKKEHQQTCPHCQKTEWPDMKKGWLLDYEINKAFCSPMCHVSYRQLQWEAENLTVELAPPELEVSSNNQTNFDWEKEGLRNEVLFLRETVRELEQRLATNQPTTLEERQQSNYLRRLQQNTLQRAEIAYQSRYGSLSEDNKPNSILPWVLGIGGILLVGGLFFSLIGKRKKKSYYNPRIYKHQQPSDWEKKQLDNHFQSNNNNNMEYNTNNNTSYNHDLPELEDKETKIKHHRTRFIIYLVLWICSAPLIFFSTFLGGLIGTIGGIQGVIWGAIIFFWAGIIACIAFLVLWVYHLIKWLNA